VVYSIIPISAFLMILYLIKDTIRIFKEIKERCGTNAAVEQKAEVMITQVMYSGIDSFSFMAVPFSCWQDHSCLLAG
ncbi:hypothetical protein ADUPG1_002058, partial [Aduncisulcus paluster]